jgi:threonine synthase
MKGFETSKRLNLPQSMRDEAATLFSSTRIDADRMQLAMRWACEGSGQVLDPHTAIGLAAARAAELPADIPVVTLATAHPGKFRDAVERATGVRPSLPSRVGALFEREERYDTLPAKLGVVMAYVADRATPRA